MRGWHLLLVASLCLLLEGAMVQAEDAEDMQLFEQTVAPIFEGRCITCHNDVQKDGGLSLQTRESLLAGGDSGPVIVVGDPDRSYLVEMVSARDGASPQMPRNGAPLEVRQVESIRRWIARGVPWPSQRRLQATSAAREEWWALQPLTCPLLPDVSDADAQWVRTPIDALIIEEFRRHGLTPSPQANRRTLIRRLYFDLLGLPPTPQEVQEFLDDQNPDAYERLVDRVLASPRYGERWARHWLDVVHYADTHGYDKDQPRPHAWPYRDYVIRAFNADKPYGQFVQEQVAGDVLHPESGEGIVALGFLAAGPWDFISHVEVAEEKIDGMLARSLDRDDMVRTVLETFNSVTIGCARCHDHKFDPFTQRDYYSLQAVFAAIDRANRTVDVDPEVARQRWQWEQELANLQARREDVLRTREERIGKRITELQRRLDVLLPQLLRRTPAEYGYHSAIEAKPDVEKWVQVDLGQEVEIHRLVLRPCYDTFNDIGAGFGFPPRFHVSVSNDPQFEESASVVVHRSDEDMPNPGLAPVVINVAGSRARYVRVTATALAPRENDFMFALAELEVYNEQQKNVARGAAVSALDSIEAPVRWAKVNLTDGKYPGCRAARNVRSEVERLFQQRYDVYRTAASVEEQEVLASLDGRIEEIRTALESLPPPSLVYAAATDFPEHGNFRPTRGQPRTIHILRRGNILQPTEEATPGVPAVLAHVGDYFEHISSDDEAARRAALARWLTDSAHPLTWRSMANRVWQYHFGRGIVDTPNDFGQRGTRPSHPKLLDWLACQLRDEQSLKRLHRLICTSAVYMQASDYRADAAAVDAENRWLWRMNRRRLEAEILRDAMLFVAGKLDETMYGPGYQDFVIEKPEHSPHYEYHLHDADDPTSHRRTIYRFIVRSQPQPFLTIWDCADPAMQVDKRNETVTPLQSLSLWNNPLTLLMSRYFAARIEQAAPSIREQIELAFRWALARPPTEEELVMFTAYVQEFGWANACRVIFNANEFLYVD